MADRNIKVLTFDLDDTLWPVGPVIHHAERELKTWMQTHVPAAADYDRETMMGIRADVVAEHPELTYNISRIREMVLERLIARQGYRGAAHFAAQAFSVFLEARHRVEYYDDVVPALRELSQRYVLGAVTNGNAAVGRLDIATYFSFAISAETIGAAKPDAKVFQAAIDAAQCSATEVVHVGDHHDHDVAGAQQLGMHTIWINREGESFPGDQPP
ncbi:MAG: HAD family hydrolase, partial [Pseudomonadota bacterium]